MKKYDGLYIFAGQAKDDVLEGQIAKAVAEVTRLGGNILTKEVLGKRAFARVRVGIGRSAFGGSLADFVLGRPAPEEEEVLRRAESVAAEAVLCVLTRGTDEAMNRFNGESATAAEAPKQEERG